VGRIFTILLCGAIALGSIAAGSEPAPVPKARVGAWEINYDTDSCNLLAEFGDGPQATFVRLTRYQPQDSFDLIVYGAPYSFGASTVSVRVGFGLAAPAKHEAMTGQAGNKLPLLLINSVRLDGWEKNKPDEQGPPISAAQEDRATMIDLTVPGGKRFRLETGSFAKPMAAMRACVDDLVKSWGYDPLQQAALSVPVQPTKSPGSWLTNEDFPSRSVMAGHNGVVQFRLDIDATGQVAGCHILHRTNPDDFADLTCKLITKRAKFSPARDQSGQPVRSYYVNGARFIIPD
jgi:TonB family protein